MPRFSATVSGPLSARDVPFSWHPGCPASPDSLRAIRLSYVGFDGTAHTGEIIVSASVANQVIKVFSLLYRARFAIRTMKPVDVFHGSDPRSMAADNTSGFNCRRAVAPGPPQWSMHAYGLAIDVNAVQNPYVEAGAVIQPPAGAAYLDRSDIRPGMAYPGGILVSAFRSAGWEWGGYWQAPATTSTSPSTAANSRQPAPGCSDAWMIRRTAGIDHAHRRKRIMPSYSAAWRPQGRPASRTDEVVDRRIGMPTRFVGYPYSFSADQPFLDGGRGWPASPGPDGVLPTRPTASSSGRRPFLGFGQRQILLSRAGSPRRSGP